MADELGRGERTLGGHAGLAGQVSLAAVAEAVAEEVFEVGDGVDLLDGLLLVQVSIETSADCCPVSWAVNGMMLEIAAHSASAFALRSASRRGRGARCGTANALSHAS
jgi:hypothetical protein